MSFSSPFTVEAALSSLGAVPEGFNLIIPQKKAHRFIYKGDRFYYHLQPGGKVGTTCISASTVAKHVAPDSHLTKWIAEKGYAESRKYMNERAWFGTFMHMMFEQYLVALSTGNQDLCAVNIEEQLYEQFYQYAQEHGRTYLVEDEFERLCKALFGFNRFIEDYEVTPILIEHSLLDEDHQVAATIDLYCELSVKEKGYWGEVYKSGPRKGQPKESYKKVRKRGLINWKSGKGHAGKKEAIQMGIESMAFTANFPDESVQFLWNWFPADFDTRAAKPSYYKIVSHETSKWLYNVKDYISIALNQASNVLDRPYQTVVTGMFQPGEQAEENMLKAGMKTIREHLEGHHLEKHQVEAETLLRGGVETWVDEVPVGEASTTQAKNA